MKFPSAGSVKEFGAIFTKFRLFTLIPRRFISHYWDSKHCLNFVVWWQWGRRCFFIRDKIIMRPTFSTWQQIINRANMGDLDTKVIQQCILALNSYSYYQGQNAPEIYSQMVEIATRKE